MAITCDPAKREWPLNRRSLDFADAARVFAGDTITDVDDRKDYGEVRLVTLGHLFERMVVIVWTPRGEDQHVISMRKANDREQRAYWEQLG